MHKHSIFYWLFGMLFAVIVGSRTAFERIARSGVLCPASCGARYAHPKNARGKLCVFI